MNRMSQLQQGSLVRLRPRPDTIYISQDRTVLATERDGFIRDGAEHGLFVHQTRLLSRYSYLIDGRRPQPVALSNVEQHTWLGYSIQLAPGDKYGDRDGDGFYECHTRSTPVVKHQAWKDSGDAIVYADGTQVGPPIATCEEQGFVYLAKVIGSIRQTYGDTGPPSKSDWTLPV